MDARAVLLGTAFAAMWASAFVSAKIVVTYAPPLTALSLRFAISAAIGIGIARALGQSWRLTRAQWIATITFGICQNALYLGANFVAMQSVEASLATIIASTMPLLVALAGWTLMGERVSALGAAGLAAGLAGVVLIMGARLQAGSDPVGILICASAVVALTIATLSVRGATSGGNVLMVVGLQMAVGAAALAVPAAIFETWDVAWTVPLGLAFVYTTLVPGLLATFTWFTLVRHAGAVRAATFHFLTPFFGVLIAALVLGEALRLQDMIGVAIIMAGILAVQLSKVRQAQSGSAYSTSSVR